MTSDKPERAGMAQAKRALSAPKRKPDDADRPPPSAFPGRRPKMIPGQMSLGEEVADDDE
jgi:hypothetical protein